jgi:hypothetical protein
MMQRSEAGRQDRRRGIDMRPLREAGATDHGAAK